MSGREGGADRIADDATDRARASVLVRVPPAEAFTLFTAHIDAWWKRGMRFRHGGTRGLVHLEPHLGGRLFESFDHGPGLRGGAGSTGEHIVEVGRVLAWEPPERLVFSWRNAAFTPQQSTTVEVRFRPASGGTQVEVEHRGWNGIPPDHPVRQGQATGEFLRTMGLWWGEQLMSLRTVARRPAA